MFLSPDTDNSPMCGIMVEKGWCGWSLVAENCQKSCMEQTWTQNTSWP